MEAAAGIYNMPARAGWFSQNPQGIKMAEIIDKKVPA